MDDKTFIQELIDIKSKSLSIDGSQERLAILNLNCIIEYSTNDFNKFINTECIKNESFTSLAQLKPQYQKINELFTSSITNKSKIKFIYFLIIDEVLQSKIFEFRPITNPQNNQVAAIIVTVNEYQEYGLIFQELKQKNAFRTNLCSKLLFTKNRQKKYLALLTNFQLTICYLLVHNYSNDRIAQIINCLDLTRKKNTTRAGINAQVERIREIYSMPSKEALIELLHFLNLHMFLPKSIFQNKLLILN